MRYGVKVLYIKTRNEKDMKDLLEILKTFGFEVVPVKRPKDNVVQYGLYVKEKKNDKTTET